MPIRFVCPYCERLLSISRRKIGTVILCPLCRGQVGVPLPDGTFPGTLPSPLPAAALAPADRAYSLSIRSALGLGLLAVVGLAGAFLAGLLIGWLVL